jgi:membrane-associated phospholipid phosphatase
MVVHEWLAVVFFAHLALAALVRPLPVERRLTAGVGSAAAAALVLLVAPRLPSPVRAWMPVLYILAAYYLAGRTFFRPMPGVERWLIDMDRRLLGDPGALYTRWPRALVVLLDTAYIGCFLLVPAGYAILSAAGHGDQADRYWTLVMGAELGAFAALPYLQTRPPWVLERLGEIEGARASVAFMQTATIGANTLPSGHAAGSLAVALGVIETLPVAGAVLLVLALTIALASIVTRAHFVVDVVTGIALALGVWWIVQVIF